MDQVKEIFDFVKRLSAIMQPVNFSALKDMGVTNRALVSYRSEVIYGRYSQPWLIAAPSELLVSNNEIKGINVYIHCNEHPPQGRYVSDHSETPLYMDNSDQVIFINDFTFGLLDGIIKQWELLNGS